MNAMKYMLVIGFLIVLVAISGCTTQTQQTPAQPNPSGDMGVKKDVAISGFAFNPATVTISKGTSVVWTNDDSATHTIVSDSGSEIGSGSISQGETYVHTFDTAGTYNYHCGIHPSMKGTIIVE